MNDTEKRFLLRAIHALEALYFENVAMNALLERYSPPDWKATRDKIMNDPNVQPAVRKAFAEIYSGAWQDASAPEEALNSALRQLLWDTPIKRKPS